MFFYQHKIPNHISLLYMHKKIFFFINTKYSAVFLFIYAQEKNIFLSTQNIQQYFSLHMHKKKINFFYSHKAVNNFECFSLIKITDSFFKPDLIELCY